MPFKLSLDILRYWAVRKDTGCAILRLPDELLCLVFDLVAYDEPPCQVDGVHPEDNDVRNKKLGFLRLSEVCRRFRALLLSMHVLWAATVFDLPRDPAMLALARSRLAPMDVSLGHLFGWAERNGTTGIDIDPDLAYHVETVSKHASRIRSIRALDLESVHHEAIFSNPLPLLKNIYLTYSAPANPLVARKDILIDAPLLEAIYLEFLAEDDSDDEDLFEGILSFFNKFDRGITFKCPALRSLEINLDLPDVQTALEPGWIVDLLYSLQLLEDLNITLDTSSSRIQWGPFFHGRVAHFAQLKTLTLHGGDSTNLPDLFSQINPPASVRCSVTYYHFLDDDSMAGLFGYIDFFVPMLRRNMDDSLQISAKARKKHAMIHLAAFPTLSNPSDYESYLEDGAPGLFQLCIELEDEGVAEQKEHIMTRIVDALRYDGTQLIIKVLQPAWPTALESITKSCVMVKDLFVHYHWDHQSPPLSLLPASSYFLTSLETMTIKFTFMHDPQNDVAPWREHLAAWRKHLVTWMRLRAEAGLRIRHLHLLEPYTDEGVFVEEDNDADAVLCAQVAEFVDELVEERVHDEY